MSAMKKIILSIFTLILALVMLMTPVFAGGNNANLPDDPAQLESPETQYLAKNGRLLRRHPIHYYEAPVEIEETACDCGGTFRHQYTIHHPWEDFEYQHCVNGYGTHLDALKKQKVVVYYECDSCKTVSQNYFYPLHPFCK